MVRQLLLTFIANLLSARSSAWFSRLLACQHHVAGANLPSLIGSWEFSYVKYL